jgi:hypothetical protein
MSLDDIHRLRDPLARPPSMDCTRRSGLVRPLVRDQHDRRRNQAFRPVGRRCWRWSECRTGENEMTSSDVDIAKSHDRSDSHDPESAITAATLAYRSGRFLDSDEGRPIRILAEYLAPLGAFACRDKGHSCVLRVGADCGKRAPRAVLHGGARAGGTSHAVVSAAVSGWFPARCLLRRRRRNHGSG